MHIQVTRGMASDTNKQLSTALKNWSCTVNNMSIYYDQKSDFWRVTGFLSPISDFQIVASVRCSAFCVGTVLNIDHIFTHRPEIDITPLPTDSSVRCDDIFALLRPTLCHGFLSDVSGAMPQDFPCSIKVIEGAVTSRAR